MTVQNLDHKRNTNFLDTFYQKVKPQEQKKVIKHKSRQRYGTKFLSLIFAKVLNLQLEKPNMLLKERSKSKIESKDSWGLNDIRKRRKFLAPRGFVVGRKIVV